VRAAAIAFEPRGMPGRDASDLDALLQSIAEDAGARTDCRADDFGLRWITLSGASLDDLALSIAVLAESLELAGCWEQVVCAVFAFRKGGDPSVRVYLIYNFERGTFYAFVPQDDARRDSAEEVRLHGAAKYDLRLEQDPQCRYPLWDIPV
jgi:PspAB-like protein